MALVVAKGSGVVQVVPLSLNCILTTPLTSDTERLKVTKGEVVIWAPLLMVIAPAGAFVSRMMVSE